MTGRAGDGLLRDRPTVLSRQDDTVGDLRNASIMKREGDRTAI